MCLHCFQQLSESIFDQQDGEESTQNPVKAGRHGKGPSKLEQLMQKDIKIKNMSSSSGKYMSWLQKGIVVKVLSKALKEHGYYKKKGVVQAVLDSCIAEICMLDSDDIVRVDERELETVLPQIGGIVAILNHSFKGQTGVLKGVNIEKFKAEVELIGGSVKGKHVWLDYEGVCKLHKA